MYNKILKYIKKYKYYFLIPLFTFTINDIGYAYNEIKTFEAYGEYYLNKDDTLDDAEQKALLEAKRSASELAGTYIESITEVTNGKITKDEIVLFTASFISIKEKIFNRKVENNQIVITCNIIADVDITDVKKKMQDSGFHLLLKGYRNIKAENDKKEINNIKDDINNIEKVNNINQLLHEADEYFMKQDYTNAIIKCSSALEIDPEHKLAIMKRGICYYYAQYYTLASIDLNYIENFDLTYPGVQSVYLIRAILNESEGNYQKAIDDINASIGIDPTNVNAHKIKMIFAFKYKDFQVSFEESNWLIAHLDTNDKDMKDIVDVKTFSQQMLNI